MTISLRKIAALAGVSPSTVTRYVRGELSVTTETARRINAVMLETGWSGVLASNKEISKVTLVIPDLINPFFTKLADSILSLAPKYNLNMSAKISGGSPQEEKKLLTYLATKSSAEGIIFVGTSKIDKTFDSSVIKKPIVILDEKIIETDRSNFCHISADNTNGAYQATNHLISSGHKTIAYIGGTTGTPTGDMRESGYREALKFNNLKCYPELVFHGPYSEAFGASVLPKIIASPHKPTAVFASTDVAALGVLGAAGNFGINIPNDISLIGFDGIDICEWVNPRLTTVNQPVTELANATITALLALASGETVEDQVFPMQLVVRSSVKSLTT